MGDKLRLLDLYCGAIPINQVPVASKNLDQSKRDMLGRESKKYVADIDAMFYVRHFGRILVCGLSPKPYLRHKIHKRKASRGIFCVTELLEYYDHAYDCKWIAFPDYDYEMPFCSRHTPSFGNRQSNTGDYLHYDQPDEIRLHTIGISASDLANLQQSTNECCGTFLIWQSHDNHGNSIFGADVSHNKPLNKQHIYNCTP